MAQYYSRAYITLAADLSENPSVPFLGQIHPIYEPFSAGMGADTIFGERIPVIKDLFSQDLNALPGRAWAFQESALSKRIIHYAACGLVWECRSITLIKAHHIITDLLRWTRSEGGLVRTFSQGFTQRNDNGRPAAIFSGQMCPRPLDLLFQWMDLLVRTAISSRQTSRRPLDLLPQWMDFVCDYSSRSCTLLKDKLPAISGVARAVSQSTGWTYLAGNWEETFPISLCWSVHHRKRTRSSPFPMPMPASEGSPSWSWTSINGEVEYYGRDWLEYDFSQEVYAKVLNSKCPATELNPFGQTKGGYVTLQGNITVAQLSFNRTSLKYVLKPMNQSAFAAAGNEVSIDTFLEECECKTPIFHGAKTLRRRPEAATYDPPRLENIFVELLLMWQRDFRTQVFLVLGRSPTVHGAHVRLGLLHTGEIDQFRFRAGKVRRPVVVTII